MQKRIDIPTLSPLTPEYISDRHQPYLDILKQALKNPNVKNVALSGPYGVGKSSILLGLTKQKYAKNSIFLSFSPYIEPHSFSNDEKHTSNSKQQTTFLQKEILKQLVYSTISDKLPDSRFKRIGNTHRLLVLVLSIVLSFALVKWLFLSAPNWIKPFSLLPAIIRNHLEIDFLSSILQILLFLCFTVFFYHLIQLIRSRIQFKEISTSAARFTIAEDNPSYFDKYLDEIVYFFERTKKTIVIFEDLDRFDNIEIFNELRALNTIINSSPKIKGRILNKLIQKIYRKTHGVTFIYAIKDEIFKDEEPYELGGSDVVRKQIRTASRTKFFDLIIPVLPFVTRATAKEYLDCELNQLESDSLKPVIEVAANHIPDARFIKNVCNEYKTFKYLIESSGSCLTVEHAQHLFAMTLYKSAHLDDYEQIRLEESQLHTLFREFDHTIFTVQERLNTLKDLTGFDLESAYWGIEILRALELKIPSHYPRAKVKSIILERKTYTREEVQKESFWREIHKHDNLSFVFEYSNGQKDQLTVSVDNIDGVSASNPQLIYTSSSEAASWNQEINEIYATLTDFTIKEAFNNGLPGAYYVDFPEDFIFMMAHRVLRSQLAVNLVKEGFITKNFAAYTTAPTNSNH